MHIYSASDEGWRVFQGPPGWQGPAGLKVVLLASPFRNLAHVGLQVSDLLSF